MSFVKHVHDHPAHLQGPGKIDWTAQEVVPCTYCVHYFKFISRIYFPCKAFCSTVRFGCRPSWIPSHCLQASQVALATDMKANLPLTVLEVIASQNWTGGALLRLKDQISRPSAKELAGNAMWLLPVVRHFPSKARDVRCLVKVCDTSQTKFCDTFPIHVRFSNTLQDLPEPSQPYSKFAHFPTPFCDPFPVHKNLKPCRFQAPICWLMSFTTLTIC